MNKFLLMIGAHCLADFPLQGDYLAKAKNRTSPLPGTPWYQAMFAHAAIHGLFVGVITKKASLGILEAVIHAITDDCKCRGKLTYNQDQMIHTVCKAAYCLFLGKRK